MVVNSLTRALNRPRNTRRFTHAVLRKKTTWRTISNNLYPSGLNSRGTSCAATSKSANSRTVVMRENWTSLRTIRLRTVCCISNRPSTLKHGLPQNKTFEQWAVLWGSDKNHSEVGGGKVVPIWKLYRMISEDILALGKPEGNAIPEIFPLLRTMQYTLHWAKPEKIEEGDGDIG